MMLTFRHRARKAFTLLEMVVTLSLLSVLMAAVFGIVGGTSELMASMQQRQQQQAVIDGFAEFCSHFFRRLDGDAVVRLRLKESGRHYLSELAVKNAPSIMNLAWEGHVALTTEETPEGYLRVCLQWDYNLDAAPGGSLTFPSPARKLVLLENISRFEWRFLNPVTGNWDDTWNESVVFLPSPSSAPSSAQGSANTSQPATPNTPGQIIRPGLIQLIVQAAGENVPRTYTLWVLPAQPAVR